MANQTRIVLDAEDRPKAEAMKGSDRNQDIQSNGTKLERDRQPSALPYF